MRLDAAILAFGCIALSLSAHDSSTESLRGIKSIQVLVEDIPEVEGLQTQIQTDVELRLRRDGITVVKKSDTYLYINVHLIPLQFRDGRAIGTAFSVFVSFYQSVAVERLPQKLFSASTWQSQLVGYADTERAP